MRDYDKEQASIIDAFYHESTGELNNETLSQERYKEFHQKLLTSSEKLELLNQDFPDFQIDTLHIIEMADTIYQQKKSRKEIGLFLLTASTLLAAYGITAFTLGKSFLITSQVILSALMPWTLIPLSLLKRKGSEI